MTDHRDILAALEAEPDSDILAAMLKDALKEERGMIDSEAERYVARARVSAWDTKLIAFAADLLRAKGPARDELHREVRKLVGLDEGDRYMLVIVAGDDPPSVGVPASAYFAQDVGPGLAIALPAGWVAYWHRRTMHHIHPVRSKRRAK